MASESTPHHARAHHNADKCGLRFSGCGDEPEPPSKSMFIWRKKQRRKGWSASDRVCRARLGLDGSEDGFAVEEGLVEGADEQVDEVGAKEDVDIH